MSEARDKETGGKPTTRTVVDEHDETDGPYADIKARADARTEPPADGADNPDPYAHLGGSVDPSVLPGAEEKDDGESD